MGFLMTGCSDGHPLCTLQGLLPPLMTLSVGSVGSPAKQTDSRLTGTQPLPSPRSQAGSWTAPSAWHSVRPGLVSLRVCLCCPQPAHRWLLLWIWYLLWRVELILRSVLHGPVFMSDIILWPCLFGRPVRRV